MTGVITWFVDCGDGVCIEKGRPSNTFDLMMNNLDFQSLAFNTVQNETTDGGENTGGSDLSLATVLGSQNPSKALGGELTRKTNTSPEEKFESSQITAESNDPSKGQRGTYRRYIESRQDESSLPSDNDQNEDATLVETRTYVDEDGNTVTVEIRKTIYNGSEESNSGRGRGYINADPSQEESEVTTTITRAYVDENGETVAETQAYQNGELVKSPKSSGADEGTEVVPGQQNGDADSNDAVIGNYISSVDSESDVIDAITVFVEPVAAGADYQNDLILNYGAFDGASMLEAYEATRADAYSQKDTLASVIEAPYNEMIYMLDPSQGPGNTTDESESLMSVAMMTVETVGL